MTGLALSKSSSVAADHDGEHAVLRAGLAAGDRRVEEAEAARRRLLGELARDLGRSRGVVDVDRRPSSCRRRRRSWPIVTVAQIVVIADAGEDEILAGGRLGGVAANAPPMLARPIARRAPRCGCRR